MKVSVITVVYNGVFDIEKTIHSVIGQKYDDYEYIIIDGGSTDGTIDRILKYKNDINQFISEPDNGIYNAMNKGIRMAKGEYCIFMNAGDMFAHSKSLQEASNYFSGIVDILTGNEISTKKGKLVNYVSAPQIITLDFLYKSSISHQASFIKRELLLEYPYDEKLRLVSDWKFWIQTLILENMKYQSIDVDVCIFNHDGATFNQKQLGREERKRVLEELIPTGYIVTYEINKNWINQIVSRISNKMKRIYRCILFCLTKRKSNYYL